MARRWTESEDAAVRFPAALDWEHGGRRLVELADRLGWDRGGRPSAGVALEGDGGGVW